MRAWWYLPTLLPILAAAPAPDGPSFDCARAASAIEQAICGDKPAAAADRDLAKHYARLVASIPDQPGKTALRESQRAWIQQRNAACAQPPPPATPGTCLRQAYADRSNALANWGRPVLPVTRVDDAALTAAYGARRRDVVFTDSAVFSPDGRILAFTTGLSDSPSAAWLYDRTTSRLTQVPLPAAQNDGMTIERFYWSDQTLYVAGEHGTAEHFALAATPQGVHAVTQRPPEPPDELKDTTNADAAGGERTEETARFVVATVNHGHGSFTLIARAMGGKDWVVAQGGWELTHYRFDGARDRLLYPGTNGDLVVVLLNTRQARYYVVDFDELLAITPDGATLAVSCGRAAPHDLCFVVLPP